MDVELAEVRDFLAAHHPYSQLPEPVLRELPKRIVTKYFRRGAHLIELGQSNDYLHIVRSGGVHIIDAHGVLADTAEPGESFGLSSVWAGSPSRYRMVAVEDTLCLLLPSDVFRHLMSVSEPFSKFFLDQHAGRMRSGVELVRMDESGSAILRTRVRQMLRKKPVTTAPSTPIRVAAQQMTDLRISALLVTEGDPSTGSGDGSTGPGGRLVGIVTDRDMRSKVIAGGMDPNGPISSIMTPNPTTTHPDTLAFEVLVQITQHGWHHLPVVEDGQLLGMVTAGDIMRLEQANPSYLVGEIDKQTSIDGVVESAKKLPNVVYQAAAQDATADDVARVITAIMDALTRKLILLTEAEIGDSPVHYCWVALGSQGRLESGMQSDQDNALLISDDVTPDQMAWFAELAQRVVDGLVRCGFPLCPGDMMASNPQWRVPLRTWGGYFAQWMNAPEPDALLNAQTFFDMRPVHGDRTLFERLQSSVIPRAPQATRFLSYLAKQAQRFEPPLGLFRDFVTSDENGGRIDLKAGGIAPVVQLARLAALSKGGAQLNTIDRLKAASANNAMSEEKAADLTDAFEFISYVRLQHQVRQLKRGQQADNMIDPDSLSSFERRHLKEAFAIIRKTQGTLSYLYRTDVTS